MVLSLDRCTGGVGSGGLRHVGSGVSETVELQSKVANTTGLTSMVTSNVYLPEICRTRSQHDDVSRRTTVKLDSTQPASGGESARELGSV